MLTRLFLKCTLSITVGKEYPWTFKLDCEPVSNGGGGGGDSDDNDDEDCPTVKVKINGFPFQRVKVKRKKCS